MEFIKTVFIALSNCFKVIFSILKKVPKGLEVTTEILNDANKKMTLYIFESQLTEAILRKSDVSIKESAIRIALNNDNET